MASNSPSDDPLSPILQVRTYPLSLFISRVPAASSLPRSASSNSPSRVTLLTVCLGDQPAPPCRLLVWGREEEMRPSRRRRREEWRVKILLHLLLRVNLLLSCPSLSSLHPLECAPPVLIVPGNIVTKATRVTKAASTTITRETTKTTTAVTAATLWTAPLMATVTTKTTSIMEAVEAAAVVVTKGDQDRGGVYHQGQGGTEEGEVEEEEGGTETETVSIIINVSTISTITTPITTPSMHHSSQDLTPTTTACRAPGSRLLLLTCCWGRDHHWQDGASPLHPGWDGSLVHRTSKTTTITTTRRPPSDLWPDSSEVSDWLRVLML